MTPLDLANRICAALNEERRDALAAVLHLSQRRGEWTSQIKETLGELGLGLGFEVSGYKNDPEFLYDMIWYELNDVHKGFLKHQKLVVECEWKLAPGDCVDDDFQKLIQARADLRLWISTSENTRAAAAHIANCEKQIRLFNGSQSGDSYILLYFTWDSPTHQPPHRIQLSPEGECIPF